MTRTLPSGRVQYYGRFHSGINLTAAPPRLAHSYLSRASLRPLHHKRTPLHPRVAPAGESRRQERSCRWIICGLASNLAGLQDQDVVSGAKNKLMHDGWLVLGRFYPKTPLTLFFIWILLNIVQQQNGKLKLRCVLESTKHVIAVSYRLTCVDYRSRTCHSGMLEESFLFPFLDGSLCEFMG